MSTKIITNLKTTSSSPNLSVYLKLGNEYNEVIKIKMNKFNKKNDTPKLLTEKNQEIPLIKEKEETFSKTEKDRNIAVNKIELMIKNIKNTNKELFDNKKEDNNILTKNDDNKLKIKNYLNKYPPKINHHFDQKFRLENKNTFSHLNESLGSIKNEKIPNIFLNHLLLKIINKNNEENYISVSLSKRKKSKNTLLIYYSPILTNI